MTRKIPASSCFPLVAACMAVSLSACQNAPTARKPGPAAQPPATDDGKTPPKNSGDKNPQALNATHETVSKLTVEKGNKELVKCIEFKGPKMTPEQLKLVTGPDVGMPPEHEFSQSTAPCPMKGATATCITPDGKNPGAFVKVVHGSTADNPQKAAEWAEKCTSVSGTWAVVDPVTSPNAGGATATKATAPAPAAPKTEPKTEMGAASNPAAPAGFSKTLTATEATYLSGVDANATMLCQITAGTKLALTKDHLGSSTGPNQRAVEFTALLGCGLTKGLITTAHWSGL